MEHKPQELTQLKLLALDSAIKITPRMSFSEVQSRSNNDNSEETMALAKEIFAWLIEEVKESPIVKLS